MLSHFQLSVNGEHLINVHTNKETTLDEFKAFVKTLKPSFSESSDLLEVKCLDELVAPALKFPINPYMGVPNFAIDIHLNNLIAVYGLEMVQDIIMRKAS